jgi:hypothetical protein
MKGERNAIRAIRWPVTVITIGVLFALQNFTPYDFGQTWPVLLIVFGLLSLLGRTVAPPPPVPPPPQYAWQPPAWPVPPPPAQPAAGGYRATSYAQGPYPQPAAGADAAPANPGTPSDSSTPGGAV